MRLSIYLFLTIVILPLFSVAQTEKLNQKTEPVGSIEKLTLEFYKISFDKQQRKKLEDAELEVIFSIDTLGNAVAEKVNGIADESIIDSIKVTTLNRIKFLPRISNGLKHPSNYFVKFSFPKYIPNTSEPLTYRRMATNHKISDFEYIHTGNQLDIGFCAVANSFLGNAGNYLELGGGFNLDMSFINKQGYGFGLNLLFIGNKRTKDYPINSSRTQNDNIFGIFAGVNASKIVKATSRNILILQLDFDIVQQNITSRLSNYDNDWIRFSGFSPGFICRYDMQIGKSKFRQDNGWYYGYASGPTIVENAIEFHAALRPLFVDFKEARGVMFEVGLGYRPLFKIVDDCKLKPIND